MTNVFIYDMAFNTVTKSGCKCFKLAKERKTLEK